MEKTQVITATRPLTGEVWCGDAVGAWTTASATVLAVVDGLGHGKHAHTAATAAMNYVSRHLNQPLAELFSGCSNAIRSTRGVAMAIAAIDEQTSVLTYAGIGNTRAMVIGEKVTRLSSNYGIVGAAYKKLAWEKVQLHGRDMLFMFTDGLNEILDLSGYGDLFSIDLRLLAEKILEDWSLSRDDAAILIYRRGPG